MIGNSCVKLIPVIVVMLFSSRVCAQWQGASGPAGSGETRCAAVDPLDADSVYLGGKALFHSSDGGKTYSRVMGLPDGVVGRHIMSVGISRDKDGPIILRTSDRYVISDDRGTTWRDGGNLEGADGYSTVHAGPAGSGVWYAEGGDKIGRSKDNGKTWEQCSGLPEGVRSTEYFFVDRFDPETISFMYYANDQDNFVLSRDGGTSFEAVDFPDGEDFIASVSTDPENRELVYVCAQEHGRRHGVRKKYYYSYDNGETWELYWDPFTGEETPNTITEKLRRIFPDMIPSPTPGRWSRSLPHSRIAWSEDKPGRVIGLAGDVILRSDDFGETWETAMEGLVATSVGHIVLDPKDPGAAFCADLRNVWRTADRGKTWKRMPLEDYWFVRHVRFSPDGGSVFVISNGIWKGTRSGEEWKKVWGTRDMHMRPSGLFSEAGRQDDKPSDTLIVVCNGFRLQSTDDGDSWERAGENNLDPSRGQSIPKHAQVRKDGKDVWYTESASSNVMKSTDHGKTWQKASFSTWQRGVWCIGADGAIWTPGHRTIEIHGKTVESVSFPDTTSGGDRPYPRAIACDPKDANTAYVGTNTGQILRTTDRGKTFAVLDGGPLQVAISGLVVSPHDGSLWVGTEGNGVWILDHPKKHDVMLSRRM